MDLFGFVFCVIEHPSYETPKKRDKQTKEKIQNKIKKVSSYFFFLLRQMYVTSGGPFPPFFSHFWAFLGEGSSKTPPKKYQKIFDPVTFWPLTYLPTTGVLDFFWGGHLV
jgi:hypothetical protein